MWRLDSHQSQISPCEQQVERATYRAKRRCASMSPLHRQTAAVILGILFAASILSSSNPCLPRRPAEVSCSTVRAETDFKSTSPPKKRERSAKCVACSIIGPCDWLLSHQPSFTAYSLQDGTVEISERMRRQRKSTHYAMVYLALVAITVKLFSRKISLSTSTCSSVEPQ
jgi:hypothetical protein